MDYNGSEYHKENARKAAILASKKAKEIALEKRMIVENKYYKNPNLCLNCNEIIKFEKRRNKFCNKNCSASFNNKNRTLTEETKNKISSTLKRLYKENIIQVNPDNIKKLLEHQKLTQTAYKIHYNKCKVCNKTFISCKSLGIKVNNKTCSNKCHYASSFKNRGSYQNGSRKNIKYNNTVQGWINLESSWELEIAEYLDENNISWIRPKDPIPWIDSKNKNHLYYPDFYLLEHDLYLDPKNEYCMTLDEEKINFIKESVNIIYGSRELIKSSLEKFKK